MTFPTIPTTAAGRVLVATQADTTATRTFPSLTGLTKNSGDLLIAICVAYQTSTGTDAAFSGWGGGFTEFLDSATSTTMAIGGAYKWSTGSETGTFDVTQAGTITGHAGFILLSIPGAHASTPPEAGSRADGTTANADPASFDPSGWASEDTLWITVIGSGEDSTAGAYLGITNGPASYTDYAETAISGDVVGGVQAAVAFRQLAASSEDVGVSNSDLAAARNAAVVIAVRPAAEAGGGTATPSAVALSASLPAPTATGGGTTAPAAVAQSATLPAPTTTGGATTAPAAVALTASLPAPTVTGSANTSPAAVALTAVLPAPSVSAGEGGTATPSATALAASLPAPTVTGGGTTTPAAVERTASLPAPTVTGAATTAPAAVALTVTISAPSATGGGTTSPAAIAQTASIPAVTVTGGANATPAAVTLTFTLSAPTATGGGTTAPAAITLTVTVPEATAAMVNLAIAVVYALVYRERVYTSTHQESVYARTYRERALAPTYREGN